MYIQNFSSTSSKPEQSTKRYLLSTKWVFLPTKWLLSTNENSARSSFFAFLPDCIYCLWSESGGKSNVKKNIFAKVL